MAVSKQVWDSFTPADREIVRESAREAARVQIEGSRAGIGIDGNRTSLDELARRNVEVVTLTPAEKQAFAAATRPVYDRWAQQVGTDLVRRAEAIVQRATA